MYGSKSHTSGGLTKKDLMRNKHGRIVSRKRSIRARRDKRLIKAGYHTKSGVFGSFHRSPPK
jgi:hypothetical protein